MAVDCPICGVSLPSSEIELHVALHFADDEPAAATPNPMDTVVIDDDEAHEDQRVQCSYGCGAMLALHELDSHEEAHRLQEMEAQQLDLQQQEVENEHKQLQMRYGFSDKRAGKCFHCGEEGHWSKECPRRPGIQAGLQQPLPLNPNQLVQFQQPDGSAQLHTVDVIPLLRACFEAQPKAQSSVYLSGSVGFHSGQGQADAGWGCGYRNIQMQISHQLMKGDPAVKQALFGSCGFVPSVASLQAWLEVAWAAGFDPGGAAMFGGKVQCTRKWIGTTEAAALLRYFGCRALLVEFLGKAAATTTDATGATIHTGVQCNICNQVPILGIRYKSYQTPDYDVCGKCKQSLEAQQHAPFRAMGSKSRAAPAVGGDGAAAAAAAAAARANASGSGRQQRIEQFLSKAANGDSSVQQHQHQRPNHRGSGASSSNGAAAAVGQVARRPTPERPDAERHRKLAEWIWAYFSSGSAAPKQQQLQQRPPGWLSLENPEAAAAAAAAAAAVRAAASAADDDVNKLPRKDSPVVLTGKPPLYLQHEGHSRTVVGIERRLPRQAEAMGGAAAAEYSLIMLDPGMAPQELINSLRSKQGWQRRVKRGLSSLANKPEYQVLYIAPGIVAEGPARDSLKQIAAEKRFDG